MPVPTTVGGPLSRQADLLISRFEDFIRNIALTNPADGTPINITGWVFTGTVRLTWDDGQTLLTMQVINRVDGSGLFSYYIPVAQIRRIGSKIVSAVWDGVWVDGTGVQKKFTWGNVTFGEGSTP